MKISFPKFIFTLTLFLFPFVTSAGAGDNISGWAWSSNIGWISFNSTNDHDPVTPGIQPSTINYGVNKNASENLVGYAWSSNIGWIQFGGLSGFPVGGGTTAQNAQVVGGNLIGWAQALAFSASWDGWISLTGTGYGVTLSGANFAGYAWGGDVVGWISFDVASPNGVIVGGGGVTFEDSGVDVSPNNGKWDNLSQVTLSYTLTGLPVGTTCEISKTSSGGTASTFTTINSGGSQPTSSLSQGSYTYQMDCLSGGVSVALKMITFEVDNQPPGFIISGPALLPIQFLGSGGADSSSKTYYVDNGGSPFADDVTVSIFSGPSLPSGTTIKYSLNGGGFLANPGTITLFSPYLAGFSLKVQLNKALPVNYCIDNPLACIITLRSFSTYSAPDKLITLQPVLANPNYEER